MKTADHKIVWEMRPLIRNEQGTDENESSPTLPLIGDFEYTKPLLLSIVFIVTFTIVFPSFGAIQAAETMQDETSYELVRGYFNEIDFDSDDKNTEVKLTHPDASRTYDWSYEGNWSGNLDYLDEENTSYNDEENSWTIRIAIGHDEPTGEEWNIIINGNATGVRVIDPETGVGITGTLNFEFEPYTEGSEESDSISLSNVGNVPMAFELEYTDDNIIYETEKDIIDPDETISFTFTYQYSPTGPEMFSPDISITAKYLGYLDFEKEGNVGITSQSGFEITADVLVGYEEYEQENIEDYSVQYKKSISVDGDTYNRITFYVYPTEELYINFDRQNVTFKDENVTIIPKNSDGEELEEIDFDPNEPISPDYGEVEITVEFKSHSENDGSIELKVERNSYKTEIQISDKASQPDNGGVSVVDDRSGTLTFGIILIVGILAFGVVRVILSKREDDD